MNFTLDEDQQAIQDMALAFAKERLAPKAGEWDETGNFPSTSSARPQRSAWRQSTCPKTKVAPA